MTVVHDEAPVTLLRGWAKAYRDTPEHRFPSDPHAEFFPVDMEYAADRIEKLTKALEEITLGNQALARGIACEALRAVATPLDDKGTAA